MNRFPQDEDAASALPSSRLKAGPIALGIVGVVSGVLAWATLDRLPRFRISPELEAALDPYFLMNIPPPRELVEQYVREVRRVTYSNAILGLGVLGAFLGALLSVGEAAARRSLVAAGCGLLLGATLGSLFGTLAAVGGQLTLERLQTASAYSLTPSIASRLVACTTLGLGVGLAVGALSARWSIVWRSSGAALLAGALAGVLFDPISACVFPLIDSETVVPHGTHNRLLWALLAAGLIGGIIPTIGPGRSALTPLAPEVEPEPIQS